jgi:murein tripeptide amidase MpaA
MPADLRFDTYYRYDDLVRFLHAFAEERPDLVNLESIGKSHEGRDLWLATVTRFATGPAEEKPALWVDGNIHATEVSASTACLYLLNKLTSEDGKNADVTRALDTRTFYVFPRMNPDGAELALADKPRWIRSSTRPYPFDEEPIEGLIREDVDGDGRMLSMRVPDPNGAWTPHSDDPRLMIRRDPTATGGQYYRLLPEGRLVNYDGVQIKIAPNKEGLDMNRNFPSAWRPEGEQVGAGEFPTSEPEVRAMVAFITSHPNITGGIMFHTFSGVLLRPYGTKADDEMPAEDLWTFKKIGDKGTEITGYPHISVFHDFKYHPKQVITGVSDDWLYDHLGVFAWTVEIWSPQRQAGITDYKFIDWYRDHPIEDDFKMLKWNDEKLDGKGYVAWKPFDHPDLGPIEIGGWDYAHCFRNPPPQFLEAEIAPHSDWIIWQALISPKLEVLAAESLPLGEGAYRVRLVVQNTGWLPTYITKKAQERKAVRPIVAEVALPDGASFKVGREREELRQLEGRCYKNASGFGAAADPTDERVKFDWVIHAPQGGTVTITVRHQKAGVVRAEIKLS